MLFLIAILVLSAALAYPPREQLGQVVQQTFVVLGGVLNTLVEGLRQAFSVSWGFWQRHFGEAFGVRPIVGGVVLVAICFFLVWADFRVLSLTFESLLPFEEDQSRAVSVFGEAISVSAGDLIAVAAIALESLVGFFVFELLGLTDFMEWDRRIPEKMSKALGWGSVALLTFLCLAHAGLAAWRTVKIQELDQAAVAEKQMLLTPGSEGSGPIIQAPDVQTPEATEAQNWLDRLPVPLMAFFSGVLPLATAASAVGLYPLLVSVIGSGVAVFVLFPLLLALGLMTLLLNFIGYAGALAQALLGVLASLGGLPVQGIRKAWELIGGPREAPSSSEAPRRQQAPTDQPQPSAQVQEALPAPQGPSNEQDSAQGLDAVVEALNVDPFRVKGPLLDQLRSPPREGESSMKKHLLS
jgi:hypothetical protein